MPGARPNPFVAPRVVATAEQAPEHAVAALLDAIAARLRDGSLRLPVRVDCAHPPAALAAVLAALHAEAWADTRSVERGADA